MESGACVMTDHVFGGDWTEIKLDCLRKYLCAYRQVFARNPKARYFKTWYVDAFAGTGSRAEAAVAPGTQLFLDVYADSEPTAFRDGSAKIALGLPEPFDNYLFIEEKRRRIEELQGVVAQDFPALLSRCTFKQADANAVLTAWCGEQDWTKTRAVVFLDPYGMQVNWSTVEALGATRAIDLWYLFPLGMGVSRLLRRDANINEPEQKRLDDLFGTRDWLAHFYPKELPKQEGLFGRNQETVQRDASVERIAGFFKQRLESCFVAVSKGLILKNSKESPMFLLCFAAGNPKGATTGLRIAQDILGD
jgi:three-Cys-motif partner protein